MPGSGRWNVSAVQMADVLAVLPQSRTPRVVVARRARPMARNNDWGAQFVPPKDADRADTNIAADFEEEFSQRSATLGELEIRWNNIKDALKRIEEGTYGICEVEGEPIELDRLEANPAAKTCKKHLEK